MIPCYEEKQYMASVSLYPYSLLMLKVCCYLSTMCTLERTVSLNQVIAPACQVLACFRYLDVTVSSVFSRKKERFMTSIKLNYGDCIDNMLQREIQSFYFHQTFCGECEWDCHEG